MYVDRQMIDEVAQQRWRAPMPEVRPSGRSAPRRQKRDRTRTRPAPMPHPIRM